MNKNTHLVSRHSEPNLQIKTPPCHSTSANTEHRLRASVLFMTINFLSCCVSRLATRLVKFVDIKNFLETHTSISH